MKLALALLLAAPVSAQEPAAITYVATPEGPSIGRLDVRNDTFCRRCQEPLDEESDLTVETPLGAVSFHIVSTFNGNCFGGCPDRYQVLASPAGFIVVPAEAEIAEEATGSFMVYRAEGS